MESKVLGESLNIYFVYTNKIIAFISKKIIMRKMITMISIIKILVKSNLPHISNFKINLLNKSIALITKMIMKIKIGNIKGSKLHMLQIYLKNLN